MAIQTGAILSGNASPIFSNGMEDVPAVASLLADRAGYVARQQAIVDAIQAQLDDANRILQREKRVYLWVQDYLTAVIQYAASEAVRKNKEN